MTHRIKVLLVEDNQADVELMTETMEMSKILCDLAVVNDGEQALKYLRREGDEYANASRPDLIFLDLNWFDLNRYIGMYRIKKKSFIHRLY